MSNKEKFLKFMNDWFVTIMFGIWFILVIFAFAEIIFEEAPVKEGLVMNKWRSEGYVLCVDNGKCKKEPTRWVIAVQNGERKACWLVSESYYDSVNIGSWVRK